MTIPRSISAFFAAVLAFALCQPVRAQLTPSQVLVVYDSRISDSRDVAEYYAGSAKVPGGVGSLPGKRPGVRVVDLNSLGAVVTTPGNIDYPSFAARLRDPLRTYLLANNLVGKVRCLVLTKGLPHRILDTDNPTIGDNPTNAGNETTVARDFTAASVDSELTLLYQSLDAGEAGGPADSKADGMIVNPYWKSTQAFASHNSDFPTVAKVWSNVNVNGPIWTSATATPIHARTLIGDMVLVCRLDAPTVANVRGMIDRAQNIIANVNTAAILLDEDPNNFDNISGPFNQLYAGNDYELTRDFLGADARFPTVASPTIPGPGINYNGALGINNFYIGPLLTWEPSAGPIVTQPVLLLASYGSNHNLVPSTSTGTPGGTIYATSFTYAPGAIFNTVESYNGRDFGGLGLGSVPQQQASSFLAAGGTFAIGNVWEPFANSIPDNLFLARNFLVGGLTWAEAAWSSIPAISWMQIVLGDPLARMGRSCEDLNSDSAIDLADLIRWETLPPGSPARDLNRDGIDTTADRDLLAKAIRQGERASLVNGRP